MSTIKRRLIRRPMLADRQLTTLHTEIAQLVNAVLDGQSDMAFASGVGVILQSPNGHYWRLSVSNAGAISATDLGTDKP